MSSNRGKNVVGVSNWWRKKHIGGGIRRGKDDVGSRRWPPESQHSSDYEHENHFLKERDLVSHRFVTDRIQNDPYEDCGAKIQLCQIACVVKIGIAMLLWT